MERNWINYNNALPLLRDRKIVVFGAGSYGCKLCIKLKENFSVEKIVFCDNDKKKQNTILLDCKVLCLQNILDLAEKKTFLIASETEGILRKTEQMYEQLKNNNISDEDILIIPIQSLATLTEDQMFENSKKYVNDLIEKRKPLEEIKEVEEVKSIVFAYKLINKTGGGPAKVLETQQLLCGDNYKNIKLSYHFKKENEISLSMNHLYTMQLGAIEFAKKLSENDKKVVYIVHDIFSAFGLAVNGKRYTLVYHMQGEVCYQKRNMGAFFTSEQTAFFKQIEMFSIINAYSVRFPSEGAEYYLWKSWEIDKIPYYKNGEPLYNTLIEKDMTDIKTITDIEKDNTVNILSIGQMTKLKGMDRIPAFIDCLSKKLCKKIQWIVVANGILKPAITTAMDNVMKNNSNIKYVQFDSLDHSEINYLFSISDMYLMLHRVSIFDIATLEAMYNNLHIVLSDIPGNKEYNVDNNVVLVKEVLDDNQLNKVVDDLETKSNNRDVFTSKFAKDSFIERYIRVIENML